MKYPRYPKYKPSGVEWLGEVPAHWDVKRGRFAMRVNPSPEKLHELAEDDEVSFVPMEAVGEYGGLDLERTKPIFEIGSGYTEFEDGDVVVAKITPCFENGKGALAEKLVNGVAFGTTELHVLRTKEVLDERYLFYLTISHPYRKLGEAEMYGAGGQKRVPPEFTKSLRIPLPELGEQQTIVDFLDAQTTRIDTLIEKKRRLIEKLKEKRAALISRTVTRGLPPEAAAAAGLDPNPKLKPSGIDWLSDVPEHWDVKRGRFAIRVNPPPEKLYELAEDDEISFVPMEAVGEYGGLDLERTKPIFEIGSGYTEFEDGDVVIAKITPCFENGKGALAEKLVNGVAFGTTELHVVRAREVLDERYLFYLTISHPYRKLGEAEMHGAGGQKRVPPEFTKNLRIPIPKLDEQKHIVDFLGAQTAKIDYMVEKTNAAISTLQEYRSALITAVITGKIDVREVVE